MKGYRDVFQYTAGKPAVVGITDYAQHSLGDIVYVELPEVGSTIKAGQFSFLVVICRDSFSSVESVKAASDAFCPATGKVLEVNTVGVVGSLDHRLCPRLLPLSTSLPWRRDGS